MATNSSSQTLPENNSIRENLDPQRSLDIQREAFATRTDAMLTSLSKDLDALAKRLNATTKMSQLEMYNAFKTELLAGLKPHIKDFDALTIPEIFVQLKTLSPTIIESFLQQDINQIVVDINKHIEKVLSTAGLDASQTQKVMERMSEGGVDMTNHVTRLAEVSGQILQSPPVMQNIADKLPEENMLSGPLNFLRKFVGMSEMDVAPREMLTFLTSFRHMELRERNAEFSKENFTKFLQENNNGFLGFFKQSKTGLASFMEFMKDSPGSVREVFGAIGENAASLKSYANGLTELDATLQNLVATPLKPALQKTVHETLAPVMQQFGVAPTGDIVRDIGKLRLALDKVEGALEAMQEISTMPLVEKAGFIRILEQVQAQKLTGDAIAAAFFGLQMLIAFNGGLIWGDGGKWAGSAAVNWIQTSAPQLGLSLNAEQIQGLTILFSAIAGAVVLGGGTAAVSRNSAEKETLPIPVDKRSFQEIFTEHATQRAAVYNEAAMDVAGFNDGSKRVLREALQSADGKLSAYVSEDVSKVRQYRSAILQVRDEVSSLAAGGAQGGEIPLQSIPDMVARGYDATRASAIRVALAGVALHEFSNQDALTKKIQERLQSTVTAPVGFENEAARIAAQVLSIKDFNAKEAQKVALTEYLKRLVLVYNQIQQVKEKPELALNEADVSLEKIIKVAETNEKNAEEAERQNQLQVELLARAALFNIEKKYSENLKIGETLVPGKFPTRERMLEVFGNAIMNSILRGVLNEERGNYVQGGAQFSGTRIENWFPIDLATARKDKQVTLPVDFDAKLVAALRSEDLGARVTKSLNDLILSADKGADTRAQLLFTPSLAPQIGRFDTGMTPGDRIKSRLTQANFDVDRTALDKEAAKTEADLLALKGQLQANDAFNMLAVLRANVVGQKSSGAAMRFIAEKVQQTMLQGKGASAFVEAWSTLQRNKNVPQLLGQYDALREKAYASGIKQPGLEMLEGEVAAMYTLQRLSTPELLGVLAQARQGNIVKQLGQGGEALWAVSKLAFMIVGWDRVASWASIPNWEWSNPFATLGNPGTAAGAAPAVAPVSAPSASLAAPMIVDMQGIATFGILTTAMYSAAAVMSVRSHMKLREASPANVSRAETAGQTTQDISVTSYGPTVLSEVEKRHNMQRVEGTWKFQDEAAEVARIDAMLADSGVEAVMLRSALASKYALSENDTASLRAKLLEELRASYSERAAAAYGDVLSLTHQAVVAKAEELKVQDRDTWIKRQTENARSSFSYLAPISEK